MTELNIGLFDIEWAKKGRGGLDTYGTDVYISASNMKAKRGAVYIGFRNEKLPKTVEYLQMARLGPMLLFKESDSTHGWKTQRTSSLMASMAIHPAFNALPNDIVELVKEHNHEGFDLNYDPKNKIWYIDTSKAVK